MNDGTVAMGSRFYVTLILLATGVPTYAQTGPTGTWEAESVKSRWTLVLRMDGPRLVGATRACGSPPIEISDGAIQGDTITFRCQSGVDAPQVRTISFTGRINGDRIEFNWELQGEPGPPIDPLFAASAPRRFVAKRVPDTTDPLIASRDPVPTWLIGKRPSACGHTVGTNKYRMAHLGYISVPSSSEARSVSTAQTR